MIIISKTKRSNFLPATFYTLPAKRSVSSSFLARTFFKQNAGPPGQTVCKLCCWSPIQLTPSSFSGLYPIYFNTLPGKCQVWVSK